MKSPWLFSACLILGGCQLLLDVESSQCERDADCVGLLGRGYVCASTNVCKRVAPETPPSNMTDAGPQLAKRWKCLDEQPTKAPAVDESRRVAISFDVVDFKQASTPDGLIVRACAQTDVACSEPIIDNVVPDSDGVVSFDLPYGFLGFYELDAPGFVPGLSFSNRPATQDMMYHGPVIVSIQSQLDLAKFGGEMIDDTLGTIVIEVTDCDGGPGDGVRLEMESDDQHAFYFEGPLPDRQLEATVVTTALGRGGVQRAVAGFSNVKPNYVTFVATLVEPERRVASFAAQVRANSITFIRMQAGY